MGAGSNSVAVVGVGQTKYSSTRGDVSMAGLVREAALPGPRRRRHDLGRHRRRGAWARPPTSSRVSMMPEICTWPRPSAASGKPMLRVHTAGLGRRFDRARWPPAGPGRRPRAGAHRRLGEAERVQRDVGAVAAQIPFRCPSTPAPAGTSRRSSASTWSRPVRPSSSAAWWRSRTASTPCSNPYAHLHQTDLTFEQVVESPMLWEPIRYSETCPILGRRLRHGIGRRGDRRRRVARPVAWMHGNGHAPEANNFPGRDEVNPQASRECADDVCRARPASPTAGARSTPSRCTCPSVGTSRCGSRASASPSRGEGWRMVEDRAPPTRRR